LAPALIQANEERKAEHAASLSEQMDALLTKTLAILDKAIKDKDHRTALVAIREARGNVELAARLNGELQATPRERVVQPLFVLPSDAQVSFTVDPRPRDGNGPSGVDPKDKVIDVTPEPGAPKPAGDNLLPAKRGPYVS
jgi:hypothetical protein